MFAVFELEAEQFPSDLRDQNGELLKLNDSDFGDAESSESSEK